MSERSTPRLRFTLTLEARGDDHVRAVRSLALLLRIALRRFNLRCVDAREVPPPLVATTSGR